MGDRPLAARALARAGLARAARSGDRAAGRSLALAGADGGVRRPGAGAARRAAPAAPDARRRGGGADRRPVGAAVLVTSVDTESRFEAAEQRLRRDALTITRRRIRSVRTSSTRATTWSSPTTTTRAGTERSVQRAGEHPARTAAAPWTAANRP